MTDEELMKATGPISHAEAKEIHKRFFNAISNGVRMSIPVNWNRDDDVRLLAYMLQCEQMTKQMKEDLENLIAKEVHDHVNSWDSFTPEYRRRLKDLQALWGGDE